MKKILLPFLLLAPFTASACFNEYAHDSSGHAHHQANPDVYRYERNFSKASLDKQIKEKEGALKDFRDSSDFSVLLAKRGYVFRALRILQELAHYHPNDYTIAANLGTVYELSGKNDSALRWIKKGIALNEKSHGGSEWVHVKILEAKIGLAKDPSWLEKNKVLGLEGKAPLPEKKDWRTPVRYTAKENHVMYQLHERMPFMSPPDALMAALLSELAAYQENSAVELSLMHYEYAKEYAPANAVISAGLRRMQRRLDSLIEVERNTKEELITAQRSPFSRTNAFSKKAAYNVLDKAADYSAFVPPAPKSSLFDTTRPGEETVKMGTGQEQVKTGTKEESGTSVWLWVSVAMSCAASMVFLVFLRRKK